MSDLSSVIDRIRGADSGDDRYLEDFINLINYRPSANRGGRKQDDEDLRANREEYINTGLDERSATAVQAINRSDRVDYEVRLYLDVHTSPLTYKRTVNHDYD